MTTPTSGPPRHPLNSRRFALSFYSDAVAPSDGTVSQWTYPDIYVADILCGTPEYVRDGFAVSQRMQYLECPDLDNPAFRFKRGVKANGDVVDLRAAIDRKPGIVYVVREFPARQAGRARVHLGYDGPIAVWWNGQEIFRGPGSNPAMKDQTSLEVNTKAGPNRLAVALDTNGGKAEAIFLRFKETATDRPEVRRNRAQI